MPGTVKMPAFAHFNKAAKDLGVLKALEFTTDSVADTEVAVPHGLGYVPKVFGQVTAKARCAEMPYVSKPADATNVYFKCNTVDIPCITYVG
jgi:hypothetical protein